MSRIINQNTEPLFIFDMPDDHLLSETISVKGEKGERGDPTKLSDLENDEGFITANTDELVNYYNKSEVDTAIDTAVDELNVPDGFFADGGVISDKGTSITLNGTANAKLKDVKLYGDTSQSATPSPSSYVPIKVATGRQAITIGSSSYEINLGKNLVDAKNANVLKAYISGAGVISGGASTGDRTIYIPCEPNTTYAVSKGLQNTTSKNRFRLGTTSETPATGVSMRVDGYWNAGDGSTTRSHTITTNATARYLVAFIYASDTDTPFEKILLSTQIEKGTTASDYSRYFTPMELAAVNSQEDNIFSQDGKWYKHKAVAKVTFTGAEGENWSFESNVGSSGYNRAIISLGDNYVGSGRQAIVSDYFKAASGSTHADGIGFTSGTSLYLYPDTSITSAEEFKTWLASHPTTVYYALATASDEPITRAELIAGLDALKQAQTSAGTTSISVSGVLPVKLYAEAYADNYKGDQTRDNDDIADAYTKSEVDAIVNDQVQFIFPKFWPNAYSGDCNLIKYQNKSILIDCYGSAQWSYVKAMLADNGVEHIDVFICSHYHGDHIGNFENLVKNGYIDADTKLFMPAETTNFNWESAIAGNKKICTTYGLNYYVPYEGEIYTIGDLKMTFSNCDAEAMDASYPSANGQNNTSTVVLFEHKSVKAYYTGDIGTAAMNRLRDLNFPSSTVELFKMAHHGIDQTVDSEYIRKLAPEYAVQPSGIMDDIKNNYGISEQTAVLRGLGTRIYPTHMQENYIIFESNGSAIQCEQGKPYGASDQRVALTYYVDKTAGTTEIQDGSQAHPFSELMQAIAAIPFKSGYNVTINVAAGYYGNAHESEWAKNTIYINTGKDVNVTINGDSEDTTAVVLNGVSIRSSAVYLNNLTVDVDNRDGIYSYNSDVFLSGVNIKSNTDTTSTTHSAILLRQASCMSASSLRIEQCNECIIMTSNSRFGAAGAVSIGDHNSTIANVGTDCQLLTANNFSFDSDADRLAFKLYGLRGSAPVQVMAAHDSYAQSVDLVVSASTLTWLEIYYRTNDGNYGSTGRIYAPNGKATTAIVPLRGGDGTLYNKQCKFAISGTTISITQSVQVHITSGSSPTITQNDTYFDILRVVGGYSNDFIDLSS